jgi:DNA modification methylase
MLHLGDCLDFMRTMPDKSVDAVITDPPYLEGDFSFLLPEFERISKRTLLTPGKIESFNWIVRKIPTWEYCWKTNTKSLGGASTFHIGFEPILSYGFPVHPPANDVFDYPIQSDKSNPSAKGHPWPKPINLIKKFVEYWSNENDTILDPFMGSGTTGVSCVQTGRNFIGIEIDQGYFKIAEKRIKDAQQQMRLF